MNYFMDEIDEDEMTIDELRWIYYDKMNDFKSELDKEMIIECELEERIG